MERIVYVQEDHFEIPEGLLQMSHEELRSKIAEEREKELERKRRQLSLIEKKKNSVMIRISVNRLSSYAR